MAQGYFISFTTYGTWLHGTAKGKGTVDDDHNALGTPFVDASAEREWQARDVMAQPPDNMSAAERAIVCKSIVE